MGNTTQSGFHRPPPSFLKKSKKKKEPIVPDLSLIPGPKSRRNCTQFVNEPNVTNYLLNNSTFLDNFVKQEVTLQRLAQWKTWVKIDLSGSQEEFHSQLLFINDAKYLFQMEMLQSRSYYPRRADPTRITHALEILEKIEKQPPKDIENDIPKDEINAVVLYLFENLLGKNVLDRQILASFTADVEINYLPTPYHNYHHGLCHTQTMYWILKSHPSAFNNIEKRLLMIASFCHDLGHPGYNEEFLQDLFKQPWFKTPMLEKHHTQTCFSMLMASGSNILSDVANEDFVQALSEIQICIVSTFISQYKQHLDTISELIEKGFSFENRECRTAAKCLLMIICDLSALWKPWEVHAAATETLYEEFVNQGEKQVQLGFDNPIMTKQKMKDLPQLQVCFTEKLALPMFEEAAKIFPCMLDAIAMTNENLEIWKKAVV